VREKKKGRWEGETEGRQKGNEHQSE